MSDSLMKFSKFFEILLCGGNVRVGDIQATPITNKTNRRKFVKELIDNLLILNKTFQKEYGFKIWEKESYLKSGKVFSGSSEHFINLEISDEDYFSKKKSTGDIDIQVSEQIEKQLHEFFKTNKTFGSMTYIGQSQSAVGQISALFDFKEWGLTPQCDFEFIDIGEDGMPTPFSHWSRSSAWKDIEQGIKGVMHKFVLANLDHAFTADLLIQKGKKKIVKKETVHMFAFSVKNGLRPKYRLVDGSSDTWEAIPAKEGVYTKDIPEIFKILFKKKATVKDLDNFNSFIGIIGMVDKYFDKKQQKKVVDAFVEFTVGKKAQKLYRGDPVSDWDMKKAAFDYMDRKLGTNILKQYSNEIDDYYNNY